MLDEHFLGDSENYTSGIEYFNYEDEPNFTVTSTPTSNVLPRMPLSPLDNVNASSSLGRQLSLDSAATSSESEETYKPRPISEEQRTTQPGKYKYNWALLFCLTRKYTHRCCSSLKKKKKNSRLMNYLLNNLRFINIFNIQSLYLFWKKIEPTLQTLAKKKKTIEFILFVQFQRQESSRTSFFCCAHRVRTRSGLRPTGRAYRRSVPI